MAKFAVLLFTTLAFQAAFAGVRRHQKDWEDLQYGIEGVKSGQLESLSGQLQIVAHDVSASLQMNLPANGQLVKTLMWQSRELAQSIDTIIDKLQDEVNTNTEDVRIVLVKIISELREIQLSLRQIASSVDVVSVSQLKNQLNINVQNAAEQIEKLVRLVQTNLEETQGGLQTIVKRVLVELLDTIQKIQGELQTANVIGSQTPRELLVQIRDITSGLTEIMMVKNLNTQQTELALREFFKNIEIITNKLQKVEGTIDNIEINTVIQQVYNKLRQVLNIATRITDTALIERVDTIKIELTRQLQLVAELLNQLVQWKQIGSENSWIQDLLGNYLSIIQQLRIKIQSGLGVQMLRSKNLNQRLREEAGILNNDDILVQDGLLKNNQVELIQSRKTGKVIVMQIKTVIRELSQSLELVQVDNVRVKKILINQIREYAQQLQLIIERLQEVNISKIDVVVNIPQVIQDFRRIVLIARQITTTQSTVSTVELKNQLILLLQNVADELGSLTIDVKSGIEQPQGELNIIKKVLLQFLTATRNLQIRLINISQDSLNGQTLPGVKNQIQTFVNGLVASLESVSIDNKQIRQVLIGQTQVLALDIENLIVKLQRVTGIKINIKEQVVENLRQMVLSLKQILGVADITNGQKLKNQLIVSIQEVAIEIQKLLWVGQNVVQGEREIILLQGQGEIVDNVISEILKDFVAALQNQQIQLQNIFQTTQYGQGIQQLFIQIQAISNNLAIYLQLVPSTGVQAKQNLEIQARKLAQKIENIANRLVIEVNINEEDTIVIQQVVMNLKQIVVALEQVTGWETSNTVYGLSYQLNVALQKVASELRKLSLVERSDLNTVVRSVLVQYLVVLQRVQIELQGINQTVQIGQTPKEVSLQIQMVSQRLSEILRTVVPDNRQTQDTLVWQVRSLSQILENILNRLEVLISNRSGSTGILQEIASNLENIQMTLQQTKVLNVRQVKIQLAVIVEDAALEIQKLMWVTQSDVQQTNQTSIIKEILIDFLAGLQNLQMQIQTNVQVVLGDQEPRILAMQIESVASGILDFLRWAQIQPNTLQLRQTLVIQIGELTQTTENIVQILRNKGDKALILQEIVTKLTKASLSLQELNGAETKITVNELSAQLTMQLQNVVTEIQRLVSVGQNEIDQILVVKTNGVLQGVLNNFLASLRTMLVQIQNTQQLGQSGQNIKELANQIQTVTDKLTTSLQNVATGTKQVRQALAIQTIKFSRRVLNVADRLETENSYNTDVNDLQQTVRKLRQVVLSLQQIGGSLTTETTIELRNQLDNQLQTASAEVQKLLLNQSSLQKSESPVVKSVLVEYLAAIQNLQIRIQFITQASQKGLTLPQLTVYIESVVNELSMSLRRVSPGNQIVDKVITIEARQLALVLANIVNKLQSQSWVIMGNNDLLQQVVVELKEIQLSLQQIAGISTITNVQQRKIQLDVTVQRAVISIKQLVWVVQPELLEIQMNSDIVPVVREVFNDFLVAVQNVRLQVLNVLINGQSRMYLWGLGGQEIRGLGLKGQLVNNLGLKHQQTREWGLEGKLSRGLELELSEDQLNGGLGSIDIIQNPRDLIGMIQIVANKLSVSLEDSVLDNQQIISTQARKLILIIKTIVKQLEEQLNVNDMVVQQVINRLRDVQINLQQLTTYSTFTRIQQLKVKLDNSIQVTVSQIQKLLVGQEELLNEVVIKRVLNVLLNGLQNILLQIQSLEKNSSWGLQGLERVGQGYGIRSSEVVGLGNGLWRKPELQGDLRTKRVEQLVNQIQIVTKQVVYELRTLVADGQQIKQVLLIEASQLIQIIDQIQTELTLGNGNIVEQVIMSLRQTRMKLQQIVNSEVLVTVQQIKVLLTNAIQITANELKQLALLTVQFDVERIQIVKDVLMQYLTYLRNLQTKWQLNQVGLEGVGGLRGLQNLVDIRDVDQLRGLPTLGGIRRVDNLRGLRNLGNLGIRDMVDSQNLNQLMSQLQIVSVQVVDELQTVPSNSQQVKQVLIIQARQLLQIIDNVIDRIQLELTIGDENTVREVIMNLRKIRIQLQQIVNSGVIITVHQIKVQLANIIETIVGELNQLVVIAQSDIQKVQMVKTVLIQYLTFLRNVQNQQINGVSGLSRLTSLRGLGGVTGLGDIREVRVGGSQDIKQLLSQLEVIVNRLAITLRNVPNSVQVRDDVQNIMDIVNILQIKLSGINGQTNLPLKRALMKLVEIVETIQRGSVSGLISNGNLGSLLRETVDEVQELVRIAQPQLILGSQSGWNRIDLTPLGGRWGVQDIRGY